MAALAGVGTRFLSELEIGKVLLVLSRLGLDLWIAKRTPGVVFWNPGKEEQLGGAAGRARPRGAGKGR
jgi:hypothetical protein